MKHVARRAARRSSPLFQAISLALVTVVGSAGLVVPVASAATPAAAPRIASALDDPLGDGSVSEEDAAMDLAKSTRFPAELVSARSETSDTWAQPDGSFSVKRYGSPVRLFRDGAWIATDPGLMFAADGTVVPKASTVGVAFSGGGTGPLLSGVKDGRTLTLSWPTALPKPVLAGNIATYSEVLLGVDLQLKAEVEGFSQLFVVKSAEAAKNPALAALTYKVKTVGLSLSADPETGSLAAVDPAGQTVFTSPTPLMWDSSTTTSAPAAATASPLAADDSAPADAFEPPPGATDAQMPTMIVGDSIQIKPDQELLTGPATTYPVYIDPSWAWGKKENWTRVYERYPRSSFWNANEVARVGYESQSGGLDRVSRSFFQVDTDSIKGALVKSSTFRIKNVWSWSCQARPVELWQTKSISKKTTWNNQPAKVGSSPLNTVNDSKGWSKDCSAGNLEFDVTSKAREAAAGKWSSITFGLYASNEGDTFGWKKFDAKTAVLETKYNNPPKTPYALGTNPKSSCSAGGSIGNTRVSLHATVDDPDAGNLAAQFQVFRSGSTTPVVDQSLSALKKRVVTLPVSDTSLPTGTYSWKVRARDADGATSGWSSTCKFSVDRTRPGSPPAITSQDNLFPPGDSGWPAVTGKAREAGTFTFAPNGVTDVDHYAWWTDSEPQINDAPPGVPASVRPPGYGPHFVYAYSVDKAGNRSDTTSYLYYATRSAERDAPGDLNGDGNKDIWSIDSNGTLLTYSGQQNGTFSSATNGGQTFDNAQVTYRTDWGQDGYTDLVTLEYDTAANRKNLWTYTNNGLGIATTDYAEGRRALTVKCPVIDEDYGCVGEPGWTGNDHWSDADQIIAPGDINSDGRPDLLVQQGKLLWAYYGSFTKRLDPPVLVGASDWDKFTVVAPGDLNNDGLADLWLRDNATGDIYRTHGAKATNGLLDPTTWGNTATRTKIGTGYPASTYPVLGSVGDLTGDGLADLWGRKTDNTMTGWPGKRPAADNVSFGAPFVIDGITGGSRIPAGTTLTSGHSYTSNTAKLTMQDDGNLVIASNANKVLWSTNTAGNVGAKAIMQANGNLVVYKADGSTILWQSKTTASEGYALLQDRGNLVIYNAKSQSLWSSGTVTRHDYNRDGRSDLGAWYNHADGTDSAWSFLTNSDGSFNSPTRSFTKPSGTWETSRTKSVTGDFNGDGFGDFAALYGYDYNKAALFTSLGKTGGVFSEPTLSWSGPAGSLRLSSSTIEAGDFNGDGRDDIALWYAYTDGSDRLWTFTSTARGTFNTPFVSWESLGSNWARDKSRLITGDFNGDGRDDLAAVYGYSGTTTRIWVFTTQPSGGFSAPKDWWFSGTFDWNRAQAHAGDFNGDGRDDIAMWYINTDSSDTIHITTAISTHANAFGPAAPALKIDNSWDLTKSRLVVGDYNGDGRDDLAAMYHYPDSSVKMWTWTMKSDGNYNGAIPSWTTTASNWAFASTRFFTAYNS